MSVVPAEVDDVRIRRCTVRVRRRGGWSWGPEPAAMAAAVARALPALIAEELARLVADPARGAATQRAPVTVKLRVTRAELAALAASVPPGATLPPRHASQGPLAVHADAAALPPPLRAGLRAAVAAALAAPAVAAGWQALPGAEATASAAGAVSIAERADDAVMAMLIGWLADGTLTAQLAAADDTALEAWARALLAARPAPPRPAGVRDSDVERVVAAAAAALARWPRHRAAEARLAVVVAARRALGVAPGDAALRAAIDRDVPSGPSADAAPGATAPAYPAHSAHPAPPARPARASHVPLVPGDARHIATALPFLALGALARLGWLAAATGFFAAAGSGAATLAAFAVALARKLVAAPERGWRRSGDDAATAACFAGCAAPLADHELARLAERLEGATAALDDAARRPFLAGHVAGDPLVLARARHAERDGWLLAEARGAFPLAWAPELCDLAPTLAAIDELVLVPGLVPAAAAPYDALAWLDALDRPFVTDARPSRGERWQSVAGEPALYASPRALDRRGADRAVRAGGVPAEARALAACAERITGAWHAIAVARPLAPRGPWRGLDASLSLAASLALADIAWRLFREREPTDAGLALDRFADLDAHVTVSPGEVRVRLPLGRRYQHLREHGLLADIPRVPWWAGRTIVFAGG